MRNAEWRMPYCCQSIGTGGKEQDMRHEKKHLDYTDVQPIVKHDKSSGRRTKTGLYRSRPRPTGTRVIITPTEIS